MDDFATCFLIQNDGVCAEIRALSVSSLNCRSSVPYYTANDGVSDSNVEVLAWKDDPLVALLTTGLLWLYV